MPRPMFSETFFESGDELDDISGSPEKNTDNSVATQTNLMPAVDTSDAATETAYPNPEVEVAALMKQLQEKDNIIRDMKQEYEEVVFYIYKTRFDHSVHDFWCISGGDIQCNLDYPNLVYPNLCLSEPSFIRMSPVHLPF